MSRWVIALVAVTGVGLAAQADRARAGDEGPVIVIPSRPGIPIMIHGCDASYHVVVGDWGLARPGAAPVTVIGCEPPHPTPLYNRRNATPYHPRYGRAPLRGRNEVEPPADRPLPDPAESFSRSWSTSSDVTPVSNPPRPPSWPPQYGDTGSNDTPPSEPVPATITDPQTYPQNFNPAIVIDPRERRHH